MPRPRRNPPAGDSPRSSTWSNASGPHHDRNTRASRRNAASHSNTRVSRTHTDGRTSGGDRTAQYTDPDPAPTAGRLVDLCNECECYLRPEEKEANERTATATTRRGRCDDCYRRSPALIAPMGGPSYSFGTSFRYDTVPTTESTTSPPSGRAGPSYLPCQHRARTQSVPCPHCEANALHRKLRRTMTLHHRPRPNQPPRPVATRRFAAYDAEVEQAVLEGRIFKRQPTQITWCIHC